MVSCSIIITKNQSDNQFLILMSYTHLKNPYKTSRTISDQFATDAKVMHVLKSLI